MINYMFFSRLVYTLPFLIYLALNNQQFLFNETCMPYALIYGVVLCLSIIFYSFTQKIMPLSLVHFVFMIEAVLITKMAIIGEELELVAFIILTSLYTIEALRNETMHIIIHLCMLVAIMCSLQFYFDIELFHGVFNTIIIIVLLSSIGCRAVMSMLESQNVVVREVIKNKTVYAVEEDNDKIQKLSRTIEDLKRENKTLTLSKDNLQRNSDTYQSETYSLRQQNALLETELEKMKNANFEKQEINKEIARSYFSLLANTRFDLTRTFDENIDNLLNVFLTATKSKYVAMICKRNFTDDGKEVKEGFFSLANSAHTPDIKFEDEEFISEEEIVTNIRETVKKNTVQYQSSNTYLSETIKPIANIIYAPISLNGDVKGVLIQAFDNQYQENVHYFNLTLMVAYQLYNMLINENLYRQVKNEANIDGLTGAYNKKHLLEVLPTLINNAYNYDIDIGLMFVDIDYFKQVNDTYGHDKGDEILCDVVKILTNNMRKTDMLFRYGGDEFVVIMSGMTEIKMQEFFDETSKAIRNLNVKINFNGEEHLVSLSMGGIIYKPYEQIELTSDELLKKADDALYEVKKSGKNRIVIKTTE